LAASYEISTAPDKRNRRRIHGKSSVERSSIVEKINSSSGHSSGVYRYIGLPFMVPEPHHERLVPWPFAVSSSKGSSKLTANQLL